MATGYDPVAGKLFCSTCAPGQEEVAEGFWAWKYFFRYQSPWSERWSPALDRLEFDRRHPLQGASAGSAAGVVVSQEPYLVRYPEQRWYGRQEKEFTDADVRANWNSNADVWNAAYDEDGDRNRKYQSDAPMLELLGDIQGKRVVDIGSGNGYLCRKLARAGAFMTGVELSDRFLEIAREREREEELGINYHQGSASDMDFLPDARFHKAVANYVLMDVRDYAGALRQVFRVLRPGGCFVAVISHPCFMGAPAGWVLPAPDSPRREDRQGWRTDLYFHRGPFLVQFGDLKPFVSFHRPLRDYWQVFVEAGFTVDALEEPSITERGRCELPISLIEHSLRLPFSCIFSPNPPKEGVGLAS